MQTILLTCSLLIVFGMLGSLAWLAVLRAPPEAETVAAEPPGERR
jgi:hypothetical protein